MRRASARSIRLFVLVVLTVALVVPALAGAEDRRTMRAAGGGTYQALAADADGNGDKTTADPLPASPVAGSLTYSSDSDDVYKVRLNAGDVLTAHVTHGSGADIDLLLFAHNGGSSVTTDTEIGASFSAYSPDMLYATSGEQFVAPADGDYYLDAWLISVPAGKESTAYPYSIRYSVGTSRPKVALTRSAETVSYNGTVTLGGTVKDSANTSMAGEPVELWSMSYPADTYTRSATTTTSPGGTFSFTRSVTKATYYMVVCTTSKAGYAWGESPSVLVKARAKLEKPYVARGTKYRNRAFTVYGYITPKHPLRQKHVRITATRLDAGMWRTAVNVQHTTSRTKYAASIVLPYRGKWKIVATTPDDGEHAPATSPALYVTVK